MYYAIMIIGGRWYTIRKVIGDAVWTTNKISYRSYDEAMEAAREMGVEIKAVGDIYQIIDLE